MPVQITMPRLSDTMQEGTLIKWRVKVGDPIKSGDLLADVETDKATMELQSFDDGTVAALVAAEGQTVAVGKVIAVLAEQGESAAQAAGSVSGAAAAPPAAQAAGQPNTPSAGAAATAIAESPAKAEVAAASGSGASGTQEASGPGETGGASAPATRLRVSPLARRIAEERGVDLSRIKGTGPDGRIIKRDIESAPAGIGTPTAGAPRFSGPRPAVTPPPIQEARPQTAATSISPIPAASGPGAGAVTIQARTIALTNMRKTIARRLVESKTTIPHFTVTLSVDMDLLLGPRGAKKQLETQGIKLSVNDFVVRAAALALLQHPQVNASWNNDSIVQHGTVNIGVAVALPEEKGGGLVVPVLRDVQNLSLRAISTQTKALAEKARNQGLSIEEMTGGTFTVSNLGMYGVDHFEAIINPPQAAILAVAAALGKPVIRNGQVVAGIEMACTLSGDHRVIDGVIGAQYLRTFKQMLENPAVLLV